jgi:peptidoglycan/xylan/chitin deacetylase (PgdA/CDA1 family)
MDVACNAATTKNEIALTFDDGPVEKNTEQILDILKSNGVEATFFCIGERISQNPSIIKRMDAENHLIGNHSFTHHFFFDLFSKEKMKQEINDTNQALEKITNRKMKFFRPPYGVTTPVLAKAIQETGLRPIGWNVRSMDTVIKNEKQLLSKIKGKLKAGDVLLFHDTATVTINSLQTILNEIKQQGLQPVRLDKLFNTEAYG